MYKYLIAIVGFVFSQNVGAVSLLESVSSKFEDGRFILELNFDKKVESSDVLVEYINQTIQLNIAGASVKSGKILERIDKNDVKSVYTYQFDKQTMRARIIHEKSIDARKFQGNVSVDSIGNQLVVVIDNPVNVAQKESLAKELPIIPPIDLESTLKNEVKTPVVSAEDIVLSEMGLAKTLPPKVEKETLTKREKSKETSEKPATKDKALPVVSGESKSEGSVVDKSENMPVFRSKKPIESATNTSFNRMIVSMIVILIFGGGFLLFIKWYSRNHKVTKETNKIRVLTQHHLGPKKSLMIVRVAGESVLLGVTDSNISMLKTLSFIDDEFSDEIPNSFLDEMKTSAGQKKQNLTFVPERDPLEDISAQVKEKLNSMRSI